MPDVLIPQVSGGQKTGLQATDKLLIYRPADALPTGFIEGQDILDEIDTASDALQVNIDAVETLAINAQTAADNAQTTADNAIPQSEKGVANGVVPLDASGKIPATYLNVIGSSFKGNWNATTNTPTLSDATGTGGDWYFVQSGTSRNLGSGSIAWTTGALAIHNGTVWVENEAVNTVISVAGKVGAVILDQNDIASVLNKRTVTDALLAALNGSPNTANAGNPYADKQYVDDIDAARVQDIADLNSTDASLQSQIDSIVVGGTTVTVGDTRVVPELFGDGTNIVGNGTEQLLNSLTNPDTGVAYTNSSAAAMFPAYASLWGSIDVTTTTYDDVVLQGLLSSFEGNVAEIHCDNKRFVVRMPNNRFVIPASSLSNGNITNFKWNHLSLDFHYSSIKINNATPDVTLFSRKATSLANASNGNQNFINKKIHLNKLVVVGASGTRSKALDAWASYGSIVENCDFNNLDIPIELRFALGAKILNNNFFNIGTYCVYQNMISSSDWGDVSNPGAQTTSQNRIIGNRFSLGNGVTGVYMRGGDSAKIEDNIFETPGSAQGFAGVHYDYGGSNNSKGVIIGNNHLEGEVTDAWYRLRLGGNCTAVIDFNYEQSPVLENAYLVNLQNETGSNMVKIRDHGNHSGAQWKLKYSYPTAVNGVAGGGGSFVFEEDMLIGNPQTPAEIQGNSSVFKLTGVDPITGYQFTSPQTGSGRIKNSARPL